jgi:hypothetical protein
VAVTGASPIEELEQHVFELSSRVSDALTQRYIRKSQSIAARNDAPEVDQEEVLRRMPIKYARDPERYVKRFLQYVPYLIGIESFFEIGVGPGFLFKIIKDVLGKRISGVDIRCREEDVYREFRQGLGIEDLVSEHAVTAGHPLPIPAGTEAVIAFFTVFNEHWTQADHEWFLDDCSSKLTGRRLVMLRFNPRGFEDNEAVRRLYARRGTFPLRPDPNFCIVRV